MTVLTKENFVAETEEHKGLVVIDLWAAWCGPCRMLAPIFDKLEEKYPDVKFCKINVDEQQGLALEFRAESIPMIAFMKDNTFLDFVVGYDPDSENKLSAMIEEYRA